MLPTYPSPPLQPGHLANLDITIGQMSDGMPVHLSLAASSPLFVSYPDRSMWTGFLSELANLRLQAPSIQWMLYLDKKTEELLGFHHTGEESPQTFLRDDPATGSFQHRKQFVTTLYKHLQTIHKQRKKSTPARLICFIDDLMDLIGNIDRPTGEKLLTIIRSCNQTELLLIAGATSGYRKLFSEIFRYPPVNPPSGISTRPPTQATITGTEIILSTDGLVFTGPPGSLFLDKCYALPPKLPTIPSNAYETEAQETNLLLTNMPAVDISTSYKNRTDPA